MAYGSIQGQSSYLSIYGGNMLGNIDMGGNAIRDIAAPVDVNDPLRVQDLNDRIQDAEWVTIGTDTTTRSHGSSVLLSISDSQDNWNNYEQIAIFWNTNNGNLQNWTLRVGNMLYAFNNTGADSNYSTAFLPLQYNFPANPGVQSIFQSQGNGVGSLNTRYVIVELEGTAYYQINRNVVIRLYVYGKKRLASA